MITDYTLLHSCNTRLVFWSGRSRRIMQKLGINSLLSTNHLNEKSYKNTLEHKKDNMRGVKGKKKNTNSCIKTRWKLWNDCAYKSSKKYSLLLEFHLCLQAVTAWRAVSRRWICISRRPKALYSAAFQPLQHSSASLWDNTVHSTTPHWFFVNVT